MTLFQLQEIADTVLDQYKLRHCRIFLGRRNMKRVLGTAYFPPFYIKLAPILFQRTDEFQLSVLLHELSHLITREGHTKYFFDISKKLHKEWGLYNLYLEHEEVQRVKIIKREWVQL